MSMRIARLIAEVLNLDAIDPDVDLMTLGVHSIDTVRIANRLEEEFGFRPRVDEFLQLSTVDALARYYENHTAKDHGETAANTPENRPAAPAVLLDAQEREQFKRAQPGLRPLDGQAPYLQLHVPALHAGAGTTYLERRSSREFAEHPLPFDRLSRFLSCLQQRPGVGTPAGRPKYQYASAGGLYPVQTYLYVKPDGVEGVPGGAYYYDPADHRLVLLSDGTRLDRAIHSPANQPIFDQSAFSLFLVGQRQAIEPMYGELSRDFCLIEAGLMAQLLDMAAPAYDIGLCHIGACAFEQIRREFALEDSHIYLYSLLGGPIKMGRTPGGDDAPTATAGDGWEEGDL
jgi:SagB-type dehydrogenase family enzyme